jgi:Xaa-Pro dipeptidase
VNGGWYRGSDRYERAQDAMRRHGYDALLAVTPENAHYLAGHGNYIATHWRIPGLFSVAMDVKGRRAVVTGDFGADPTLEPPYLHLTYGNWIESIDIRQSAGDAIAERASNARPHRLSRPPQFDLDEVWDRVADALLVVAPDARAIGVDLAEVDAQSVASLLERLEGILLEDATQVFDDLRALKDPDEREHLRLACELTELGIAGALARVEPGMAEVALNSAYQVAVHEQVIAQDRFATFRQAEGLASIGIGADQPRRIEPGQTIKFDMQVDIAGYHSDVGRTYAIQPTAEQQEVFDALLTALQIAEAAIRPGVAFADVYEAGAQSMHAQGFTNYSRGHLGHSVGLTQRFEEPPFISPVEFRAIAPSMMLSLELPYYIYGVGAFQMERMIEVTADGAHAIDRLPFRLAIDPAAR